MAGHRLEVVAEARNGRARAGVLHTARGPVQTPLLCLVAAGGSLGGVTPGELSGLGAGVLLVPTFELLARPGADVVRELGGVHRLTGWDGPIVTDDGGAQMLALGQQAVDDGTPRRPRGQPGRLVRVDEDGATFTSPIDGAQQRLTPEMCMATQEALGGDIIVALGAPARPGDGERPALRGAERTAAWLRRCLAARTRDDQALYGAVPGSAFPALCAAVAADAGSLPFDGVSIGGPVGDNGAVLDAAVPVLPPRWPRQAHSGADVLEIVAAVDAGVDQLVSAAPARLGQRGRVLSRAGTLDLSHVDWRDDPAPIDPQCACPTCRAGFSRGYLRHLFVCDELLGYRLATLHNAHVLLQLMRDIRAAIMADVFAEFRAELLARHGSAAGGGEAAAGLGHRRRVQDSVEL